VRVEKVLDFAHSCLASEVEGEGEDREANKSEAMIAVADADGRSLG
jgi:hypothetical protein